MNDDPLPLPEIDGYRLERCGARAVYVRPEHHDAVAALGFLDGEPRSEPVDRRGGRVVYPIYPLTPDARVIWKHCRRGGWAEPILDDRHFDVTRFVRELELNDAVRRAGLPVAEIIALAVARGRTAWRVEMLTRVIDGARDLADALRSTSPDDELRVELAEAVATLLRRFHGAGFRHGDLNVKNVLWRRTNSGTIEVTLIDLDPGRRDRGSETPRHENLLRLWRSVVKGEWAGRWVLSDRTLLRFLHTYFRGDRAAMEEFRRRAGRARRLAPLRYGWRRGGRRDAAPTDRAPRAEKDRGGS
ncbi:MAG: hypothetical protein KDC38_11495 [Planctomycetes bacterium]|nr:hypothetical protein [Planctomycetota bacterium]